MQNNTELALFRLQTNNDTGAEQRYMTMLKKVNDVLNKQMGAKDMCTYVTMNNMYDVFIAKQREYLNTIL
ncbi:hypothetical protein [Prevotella sp. 10(H)]|uniref:hypothetical protein n=1 Tax=Prevotella sp. 10(H) TaxID=1158294 RepID=UPI0004A6C672|nr:hypothetical protein [Prevotella sp. 10(H)]